MAAATGHAKLRRSIVEMLLLDRQAALRQRNPSAAISASTKIADLVLRQAEEEAAKTAPITKLTTVLLHAVYCPACRERQPATDYPPPPPPPSAAEMARQQAASAWAEAEAEAEAQPDPVPTAPIREPEVLKIPKTPEQMRRRRRDPTVKGLA